MEKISKNNSTQEETPNFTMGENKSNVFYLDFSGERIFLPIEYKESVNDFIKEDGKPFDIHDVTAFAFNVAMKLNSSTKFRISKFTFTFSGISITVFTDYIKGKTNEIEIYIPTDSCKLSNVTQVFEYLESKVDLIKKEINLFGK